MIPLLEAISFSSMLLPDCDLTSTCRTFESVSCGLEWVTVLDTLFWLNEVFISFSFDSDLVFRIMSSENKCSKMMITNTRIKNRANDGILLILRLMIVDIVNFELTTTGDLKYQLNFSTQKTIIDDVIFSFTNLDRLKR